MVQVHLQEEVLQITAALPVQVQVTVLLPEVHPIPPREAATIAEAVLQEVTPVVALVEVLVEEVVVEEEDSCQNDNCLI